MIDYGIFQFACPPGVGEEWFVRAAQAAGRGPGFPHRAYGHFQRDRIDRLRVGLVCNPFDWLATMHARPPESNHAGRVGDLPRGLSLRGFAEEYLEQCPGELTRLALAYEADTVLRLEDCPGAFLSLVAPFADKVMLAPEFFHRRPQFMADNSIREDPPLAARFRRAERELFDRYDYW